MAPDPVTALGLAGNVVQFVSFASKLISKGYKYYESTDGHLIEHSEQAAVAANLVNLTRGLDHSLTAFATSKNPLRVLKQNKVTIWAENKANERRMKEEIKADNTVDDASALIRLKVEERKGQATVASIEEKALQQVTEDCRRAAEEFLEALDNLKVQGNHRGWQSFRQAFKTLWGKDKIDAMLRRLSMLQEQLMIHLLVVVNNNQLKKLTVLTNANAPEQKNTPSAAPNMESVIDRRLVERYILESINEAQREFVPMRQMLANEQQQSHRLHEKSEELRRAWANKVQSDVGATLEKLSATLEACRYNSIKQQMLDSLYFTQIGERQSKIPEAHVETFKWIFQRHYPSQNPWTNFADWCSESNRLNNLYWIAGKAGSGKSTLMRYLFDCVESQRYLQRWAGSRRLVLAKCFFWNPGTDIQKSWIGLLRSLLYDILHQCQELVSRVAPARWRSYEFGTRQFDTWTEHELFDAFHTLVREAEPGISICLFIDGLDEFQGSDEQHLELTEFFKTIANSRHVKVCVSSRPWLVFHDQFAGKPQLLLEDLTRNDIQAYIRDMLGQNPHFQMLRNENNQKCSQLVSEITERAHGVFLWVYLVVRSLRYGLRDGDSLSDLEKRLRLIPTDLEPYFEQMMNTIDPFYRYQATTIFRLVLDAPRPLSLMTVSFLEQYHEDTELALNTALVPVTDGEIQSRLRLMKRRLNSRCKGLVEAQSIGKGGPFLEETVDFMHRTVRDFLLTPEAQQMLHSFSAEKIDTHNFVLNALIAQVKLLDVGDSKVSGKYNADDLATILDEILCYVEHMESVGKQMPLDLLRDLDQACASQHKNRTVPLTGRGNGLVHFICEWLDSPKHWDQSFLTLTIQTNRTSYAKVAIASNHRLVVDKTGRPLLDSVLRRRPGRQPGRAPNIDILRTILYHGGDPNQMFEGSTVWLKFLVYMVDHIPVGGQRKWRDVTEVLIRNGASRRLPTTRTTRTGTNEELHYNMALYHTPYDFFNVVFGETEADKLTSIARRQRYKPRRKIKHGIIDDEKAVTSHRTNDVNDERNHQAQNQSRSPNSGCCCQ